MEAEGISDGLSLSLSADGAKEGTLLPIPTEGLVEAEGESERDGILLPTSSKVLGGAPSADGAKEGTSLPIPTEGLVEAEGESERDGILLPTSSKVLEGARDGLSLSLKEGVCDKKADGLPLCNSVGGWDGADENTSEGVFEGMTLGIKLGNSDV